MTNPNAPTDAELKAMLLQHELDLMDPVFRKDSVQVSALLAEDFREFGSSGRVWSRETILELLTAEMSWTAPVVEDFEIRRIAEDTVLVTYRAARPEKATLRSSLWVRRDEAWKILFHQGTVCSL